MTLSKDRCYKLNGTHGNESCPLLPIVHPLRMQLGETCRLMSWKLKIKLKEKWSKWLDVKAECEKVQKLMSKEEEFESQWRQSLEKCGKDPVKCFASISWGCKLILSSQT